MLPLQLGLKQVKLVIRLKLLAQPFTEPVMLLLEQVALVVLLPFAQDVDRESASITMRS